MDYVITMNEYAVGLLAFLVVVVVLLIVAYFEQSRPEREYGVKSQPEYGYGVRSVTAKGEEVRSIAERRIADYFKRNNIKYVYEQEAKGKFLFFEYPISSPDFYLPDYDVYVEYWGLVDADDRWTRTRYVKNMKRKMAIYHENNIKFISIYPRNLDNLDWIFGKKFRKVTGFELPS